MGHTSTAVVFESPGNLSVREVLLPELTTDDCLVEVLHSGISTGTERLLWTGDMPFFPGLQYPLVPGYESVGRVLECGADSTLAEGQAVFIPGSRGFEKCRWFIRRSRKASRRAQSQAHSAFGRSRRSVSVTRARRHSHTRSRSAS